MQQLPHNGSQVQESLDMILTTAAFDQQVSLLFIDHGIYQLKRQQSPTVLGLKDTAAIFTALEIYNVEALYVEQESLVGSGLQLEDLILPVQLIERKHISAFLQQHDVLIPD